MDIIRYVLGSCFPYLLHHPLAKVGRIGCYVAKWGLGVRGQEARDWAVPSFDLRQLRTIKIGHAHTNARTHEQAGCIALGVHCHVVTHLKRFL